MAAELFVPFADGRFLPRGWRGVVDPRAALAGLVALVAAGIRVAVGSQSGSSFAVAISLGALVVALTIVYVQLRKRNAGLYLQDHTIGIANPFGRRRGVDAAQVDYLLRAAVASPGARAPIRILLFVDRKGRAALRFYAADVLVAGGVAALATRAGVPLQGSWDEVYTPTELQNRYPGALSRLQMTSYAILERPARTAWIVGGLTLGAFLVLAVALLSRPHG